MVKGGGETEGSALPADEGTRCHRESKITVLYYEHFHSFLLGCWVVSFFHVDIKEESLSFPRSRLVLYFAPTLMKVIRIEEENLTVLFPSAFYS